ncbi:MAG: mechanosensitive ion channel family protein [Flavobacteriaceae bacterium]|nr:mechanosensitive ion channel family protein [Flavobacteriaceae bacterium]
MSLTDQVQEDASPLERVEEVKTELVDKILGWVDSAILNLPNFILAIIVFILFIISAKYISSLVGKIIEKSNASKSIQLIMMKVTKVTVIMVGFFVALGILNLNTVLTSVLGAAGVVGLAVGLALQGTLNNTFSGVVLSFQPRIQIGDWIETDSHEGRVIDINLRNVVLQTPDQNMLIIPNANLVNQSFKNYSNTNRGRVTVECGVGYESDLDLVQKITTQVIKDNFKQRNGEGIEFYYVGFGDSSIDFKVRFWSDVRDKKDVLSGQHKAILEIKRAFNENNINIPFPIRTLDFGKNKFRSETISIINKE